MTPVRLSICIPTYNFGKFIGDAIKSVQGQYVASTDIVILDGGSTDGTREVVESYQAKCPYIQYHFQSFKGGIDADLARSVELAQGDYCWLLSADDALVDGALERIHRELDTGCDVYLCNRVLCDISLKPERSQSWLRGESPDFEMNLGDDAALFRHFGRAVSVGALFSYMSTIIFKRSSWALTEQAPEMMGTNYSHVHRLFSMRGFNGRMKYLAAPLVLCRSGNDSFMGLGVTGRYLIDMRGFDVAAHMIFPHDARLRSKFKDVVNREHRWTNWVWLRSVIKDEAEWAKVLHELKSYGYGTLTIFAIERFAKSPLYAFLHALRKLTSRILSWMNRERLE
ncbi:MAG: glycosyltransferase family 2 protein [Betaproteobacteria bacterium]|nr:glycosyltransferase family 2 protein [Betaproteobacteria bacterium]